MKKALIFNEFNVEQPRGHMAFVQSQSITDEQHCDGASAGLQSRSSGIVNALACKANQNFADNEETIGSGFLSSSTRFTTALHVVVSELHSGFVFPKPIKVHFGSSGDGLAINNYVADSGVDQRNLDYDEAYRYDAEEDPYLPMRLFQLGLNAWAWNDNLANSQEWRKQLRMWKFEIAEGHSSDGTFFNQGFANVDDNTNIRGEDIAVLKVIGLENACPEVGSCGDNIIEDIWDDLQAGEFPLNRPGVFFDHMKPVLYTDLSDDKPLWMEHSNDWPLGSNDSARLISRPGYPMFGGPDSLVIPNDCSGEEDVLEGLVAHTLDMKGGSSGGAILSPYYESDSDGYGLPESKLAVFGVNSAQEFDSNAFTSTGFWTDIGPVTTSIEPNPVYDGLNANYFTGISNPALLREDPDPVVTSFGDPEPCEPGETVGCILCENHNGDDECIEFAYSEGKVLFGCGHGFPSV